VGGNFADDFMTIGFSEDFGTSNNGRHLLNHLSVILNVFAFNFLFLKLTLFFNSSIGTSR
jgi:hypothetical protein